MHEFYNGDRVPTRVDYLLQRGSNASGEGSEFPGQCERLDVG